jgi:RNA polymerase sigma factor (sigma-70 family)
MAAGLLMEAGDVGALYQQYRSVVVRRARQLLGSADEAEDVTQEIFTSILTGQRDAQEARSPAAWIYTVTTRVCLNRIRDGKNRGRLLDQKLAPALTTSTRAVAERMTMVRAILGRMPEDLARATVHYYMDEMTHEEIAELMACSRRHVGHLLERAVAWLAQEGVRAA